MKVGRLDIASRMIGGKSLILDQRNNVGSATFKGSLVIWSKKYYGASKHCVVVKPSEVSQITALPFTTPAREFLLCKTPNYSPVFDPKGQCVEERYDPEVEFSSDVIDTNSARCVEIALKNPCSHYTIYVRNH